MGDEVKRREYDNPNPFGNMQWNSQAGDTATTHGFNPFDFSEMFRQRRPRRAPQNMQHVFRKIHFNKPQTLKYDRQEVCNECNGEGGPGESCKDCKGSGFVFTQTNMMGMVMNQQMPCQKCNGLGFMRSGTCQKCNGSGTKTIKEEVYVSPPIGSQDITVYVYKGKGSFGGDMEVMIN